jgi:YD repeat-containing protein
VKIYNKIIQEIIVVLILMTMAPSFAETVNYTYDALNRLVRVDKLTTGKVIQFQYDVVGNRTQRTVSAGPVNPTATLYASFDVSGIWKWDGTTWSQLNGISPVRMAAGN